jgi:diguanylate cyclase (GGDEF)-like protein
MKIEEIVKDLSVLGNIYDIIRIVDPITKIVYDTLLYNDIEKKITNIQNNKFCYEFWNLDKICDNCVSTRALNTGKSYLKMEYNGNQAFLVTTSIIIYEGKKYILELLRLINSSDVITSINSLDYTDIHNKLKKLNLEIVEDHLTGAYNKKFIIERIPNSLAFFNDLNNDFSLIICDIDKFKYVNDAYGHLAGDYILKEYVKIIKNSIRINTDWVGRYGGDEFVIYLDNINIEATLKVVEIIRKTIDNTTFHFENFNINITSSFGITKPEKNDTFDLIIKKADNKLYESKNDGRNKISY